MEISYSEEAIQALTPLLDKDDVHLKLIYDTEGCGCAVNGVPTLSITHVQGQYDITLTGKPFNLLMQKNHAVYFEEKMTIDYRADKKSFILKSNNQIYNASMSLITT
ncbi:iron-sulfur cluster biosynthesis family protein [Paenibacillus sp. KN14-4R]|uniref:iron-sulfur cluster biosynthesis family protein n=1 Tax=Paenibacillus sp. KN14-4R TaxID=3445773 RepID=UPI003F9FA129